MFSVPKSTFATIIGLITFSTVWSAATPVLAAGKQTQETPERASREREARRACLTGEYTKGVGILADLFLDTKNPTYIFNQGRCFEQNRQYADAIARFQEFLRASATTELDPGDRAAAERHINDCKGVLAEERDKSGATAPAPFVAPASEPAKGAEPPREDSPMVATQSEPKEGASGSGAGLRIGGIVTASVGLAAVATGVVFNLKANSLTKQLKDVGGYSSSKESDRKTYRTAAWIGYGAGAACLVTGVVLTIIGYQQTDNTSSNVAFLPVVSNGQAGVAFSGGF
jgi:hypothetical protein